jgi:2-amino-4-hydroxy-6-hydroxymethyldihydropteridine diphosphokinase
MAEDSPSFLNQVVKGEYAYPAGELLLALEQIERHLGRDAKGERQARTMDLDILLFGQRQIKTDNLEIPHPRLLNRAFVLVPLLEIDPELTDLVSGKPLCDFITKAGRAEIEVYRDHVARQT